MRRLHRDGIVAHTNRSISIVSVLAMVGAPIPAMPEPGTTLKAWCPWSEMHPDGGREKEMRVYPNNEAFCFVCQLSMDPVAIAARYWGANYIVTSKRLQTMAAEGSMAEAASSADVGSGSRRRASAVAALARWADANSIDRFGKSYGVCLQVADGISRDEHVAEWLTKSKAYLLASR